MFLPVPNLFTLVHLYIVHWYTTTNSLYAKDKVWRSKFPCKPWNINAHASKGHAHLLSTCWAATSNDRPSALCLNTSVELLAPTSSCCTWVNEDVPLKDKRKEFVQKSRFAICPSFARSDFQSFTWAQTQKISARSHPFLQIMQNCQLMWYFVDLLFFQESLTIN